MLVLSRKRGECLVIDGSIRVRVIEVKGETVRLGIEAPKEVPVHRHEVFERLAAEGLASRACLATV
jgi:carbon storage regulator